VSFEAPFVLLALLLVPAAAAAYLLADRAGERAAAAFATPATRPSVAPVGPGWRRHAPMAAYALALAGLIAALARPQATVAVQEQRAAVVLATDQSGSMRATDVAPSRLEAARAAARDFLDDVPEELAVGAVFFDRAVRGVVPPTLEREALRERLDALRPLGGTATGNALAAGLRLLERRRRDSDGKRAPGAIVLLSDGVSTQGRDPLDAAREAAAAGVRIYTVTLGTAGGTIEEPRPGGGTRLRPVPPPDTETLDEIARITRARAYTVSDRLELDRIYEELGSQISTRPEKREITGAFAGVAGLLLVGGGAMSLRWFGRLP